MASVASGGTLRIPFKNENILAEHTCADGSRIKIIAFVPDLIAVLDNGSGRELGVTEFKYDYRVTVMDITCSPQWTSTAAGLKTGGPNAFGYDGVVYKPIGEYVEPASVIWEYSVWARNHCIYRFIRILLKRVLIVLVHTKPLLFLDISPWSKVLFESI
jgi:hypothetical protein